MFGIDIRVIVPQLAMSAGTMVALASREILMGKHSSLGPIDPQIFGMPAHGIIEEFETAKREIQANPAAIPIWQPIIAKYTPTLIGEAQKSIDWSNKMVKDLDRPPLGSPGPLRTPL
jgi:ClpP class serine protease